MCIVISFIIECMITLMHTTDHSPLDFLLKPRPLIHSHLPRVSPTPILEVKVHPLKLATLTGTAHHTKEDRYTITVCLMLISMRDDLYHNVGSKWK